MKIVIRDLGIVTFMVGMGDHSGIIHQTKRLYPIKSLDHSKGEAGQSTEIFSLALELTRGRRAILIAADTNVSTANAQPH